MFPPTASSVKRKFSSYGPILIKQEYYVPRTELIDNAQQQLLGDIFEDGGHYITIWAPRQRGKSWMMQQVLWRLGEDERVNVLKINLEHLKLTDDVELILRVLADEITKPLDLPSVNINTLDDFYTVFQQGQLKKPLILILDEFDALHPQAISALVGVFRNIYNARRDSSLPTEQKPYFLHGVALIGVRAVLGVENATGSPFNVQRSVHIPNLTYDEVHYMFDWYQAESGQVVEKAVVDRLFYELQGQPGLTSWLGELLTEKYALPVEQSVTMAHFEWVYSEALNVLPNNNILNILSKVQQEPYQELVLTLYQSHAKLPFRYDHRETNFLYMNGAVDIEREAGKPYVRFANPFVQKRVFNYFSYDLFPTMDRLHDPFADLSHVITETTLNVPNLLQLHEDYLKKNQHWLLKNAPRRKTDLRIVEAVYHFGLYMFLSRLLMSWGGQVVPEFPTGNGKVDLIIRYAGQSYGLEVKSYANQPAYKAALQQAADYGRQLGLPHMWLVLFVEAIDETNRQRLEVFHTDPIHGITVQPVFVQIGSTE